MGWVGLGGVCFAWEVLRRTVYMLPYGVEIGFRVGRCHCEIDEVYA